jgi:hypothetical protein
MTGDMPACSQRYFSLAGKRYDFKDIAEEIWNCREADFKDVSGGSVNWIPAFSKKSPG